MYACAGALALCAAVAPAAQLPDAAEVLRRSHPIHQAAAGRYLTRLGRQLAAQLPGPQQFHFTFTVIADDPYPATHEPSALPGGLILVPAALFGAVDDEAEFAAMIAHALAHIVQRHAAAPAARNGVLQADALAISLAANAGFDPGALARYIARVQPEESTAPGLLPSREQRLRAMQPVIERFPAADFQVSSSEFMAIQREVSAALPPKRKPRRPDK
jgi:predicted Zn-dependent protease